MRRQKCSQCGTMLDVSNLEKDSKFACSNCGEILVVGEAAVVKRSLKEGTGFKRKATDGDAPAAPQRSGRRRAAAESGGRRRDRDDEPAAKSKLPLMIGIGVVVVVGVVVAITMGSGETKTKSKAELANEWWANVGVVTGAPKDRLERILSEARAKGFDQDAAWWAPKRGDIMKALRAADPFHEEANREAGRKCLTTDVPGFAANFKAMNEAYVDLPDKLKKFVDGYSDRVDRGKKVWLKPDRFDEARGLLAEFVAWKKERDANPARKYVTKAVAAAKPLYRGKVFAAGVVEPWILLTPFAPDPEGAEGTERTRKEKAARATKIGAVLPVAYSQWNAKIAKPLNLPAIKKDHYFKVLLTDAQADLATYLQGRRAEDSGAAPEVVGFFRFDTKWAGASAVDDEALKPYIAQDLAHVAIHQLQHYHSQDPKDKYENWFDEWNTKWLNEGLAEWLGGGVQYDAASGKATFNGFPKRRIEFLRQMKDNGVPLMRIRDIVQLNSLEDWQSFYATWSDTVSEDDDVGEGTVTWLRGVQWPVMKFFYTHSWYLVHFLHESGDGKYREQFLAFVQTALRGKYKPEKYAKRTRDRWINPYSAFRDIFGVKEPKDWEPLQKDYERYLKRMLRKAE